MIHTPIEIINLSYIANNKICFEDFNTHIDYGSRIGIIGRNGSGKSSLLKILQGILSPTYGNIQIPENTTLSYVPQTIENFTSFSGAERFNKSLTKALSNDPNILLLDEPTNHLDYNNRKSLLRKLDSYPGTLIIVSHDVELLNNIIDILWHIDQSKIHIFKGNYNNYLSEIKLKYLNIESQISHLQRDKKNMHQKLMQEQKRASKSKAKGQKSITQKKWPTVVSKAKATRAQNTSGRKKAAINNKKQQLVDQLSELKLPEEIMPKFSIIPANNQSHCLLAISNGSVAYGNNLIIENINLSLYSKDRIAISGNNGSGKSTLLKAILDDSKVSKLGDWHLPKSVDIGYLDQHYNSLSDDKTVIETIKDLMPESTDNDIRRHLNDFLFRNNEEVNNKVKFLSGGEKVRLILAQIAAKTPNLLILDELTNNLDLETRQHVIQVIKEYPGSLIVISHDQDFLNQIGIKHEYIVKNQSLYPIL